MKTWFNIWVVTTLFTRELLQRRKNVIIKKFKCNICDYKTAHKPDLKRHIESVHERIKSFKCSICEYKFGLQRRISTRKFMWCQYQNRDWISLKLFLPVRESLFTKLWLCHLQGFNKIFVEFWQFFVPNSGFFYQCQNKVPKFCCKDSLLRKCCLVKSETFDA